MTDQLTAGIDIGTTSIKALVADADGQVVARRRHVHHLDAPRAGRLSHDAAAAWCDDVREVWRALTEAGDIAAVTVSAMVPSLTAVAPTGRPFAPGVLYGDDRGEATVTGFGEQGELASFVRWAASTYPDAAGYWPAQAVANAALCGVGAVDSIVAIMAGPLSDGAAWVPDECASIGVRPEQLPVIGPGNEPIGEIDGGTLVSGGTVDALAEQLVAGADGAGDVLVICGATLITWALADGWPEADGLWTVPHTSGNAAIGGASNAGGLFLERVRQLVGERGEDGLDQVRPDRVPVWVPHIRGERVPVADRTRRASLHDLDIGHEPGDVLRAGYEASAFTTRQILERADVAIERVVVAGGGTNVSAWMQALADALDRPVATVAVPEGAALGAAYLSRITAGFEPDASGASRWARAGRTYEPRADWVGPVDERFDRFRQLTETVR